MGKTIDLAKAAATQGEAPATKSTKKAKAADVANAKNLKKEIAKRKDGMYRYKGEMTLEEKKKFRATARRKAEKYTKLLKTEKGADREKALKNARIFAKNTYTSASMPEYK